MHRFAFEHNMRITPYSPRKATHIAFGKIHSANKAHTPVNHYNFSMIPIIYPTGKQRKTHFQKLLTSMPALRISSKKRLVRASNPHRHRLPYFNSLRGLFYQYIPHQTTNGVILKDIIFHVDMLFRLLKFAQ